jgi:protocatechuate 3,4-dioxygenase beta subunit
MARLETVKPGPHSAGGGAARAPHLRVTIFASGIDRLVTEVFFEGEPLNDADPVLTSIPDRSLRQRLIARAAGTTASEARAYVLVIVLRGERETPFFDDWVR